MRKNYFFYLIFKSLVAKVATKHVRKRNVHMNLLISQKSNHFCSFVVISLYQVKEQGRVEGTIFFFFAKWAKFISSSGAVLLIVERY